MTKARDPEALLTAYLAIGMDVLPDRVADAVMDEVHRTHQRGGIGSWQRRRTSRATLAAAVAVAAVTLGSAFFVIQRGQPAVIGPAPTASASPDASQPAVVAPSATPAPAPTAEASPSPVAQSSELTWTKVAFDQRSPLVAWLGDRFVLADEDSGAVYTSTDGVGWDALRPGDPDPGYVDLLRGSLATWGDQAVGWRNPEDGPDYANKPPVTARDILRIVRPPAAVTESTPFKGRIQSMAIGPAGIVAQVHSHLDWDEWVASKLGRNWVAHYTGVDYKNGILRIRMDNGPGLRVVWADEGFEPGDYQDAGFGWFSPDGEQWTLMPAEAPSPDGDSVRGFLTGFGDVVGVSDGFIARGVDTACSSDDGCAGIWHSSDGLTWRNIGNVVRGYDGSLLPWMGGALVTDGVRLFEFWTSQGGNKLPMAAEVRAASKQPNEPYDNAIGTGPLGAVMVSLDNQEILVTRDGVDWDIQTMPAQMAAESSGRGRTTVAVGERSVLVLVWGPEYPSATPSLWLGTPEP